MKVPEWQIKNYGEMSPEEKELYDAWDPIEEEAIAASHAILQRACDGMVDLPALKREAKWRGYRVSVRGGLVRLERDGDAERFDLSSEGLEAAFDWLLEKLPPEQAQDGLLPPRRKKFLGLF